MYAFGKMMRKLIAKHGTSQAAICRATGIVGGVLAFAFPRAA